MLLPCLLEFTKTAVFFILLKKALSHSPRVSGVREQDTTIKSLSDTRVSMGTGGRGGRGGRNIGETNAWMKNVQLNFSDQSFPPRFPSIFSPNSPFTSEA